jgi:hypothetical protein
MNYDDFIDNFPDCQLDKLIPDHYDFQYDRYLNQIIIIKL